MIRSLDSIIRQHSFFKGLEERHIQFIVGCAKNVRFDSDQYIFHEGDSADQFFFILEGLVSVELNIPAKGPTTVQTVGEGDVFGWSWLAPPYRWHFDARTLRKTHALAFDGKCLRAKCEEDHDLGYEILKRFSNVAVERLDATRLQLLDFYGEHV
jgi:CRP/FNR family transcriptional regulator, cyclic AMP receptor protein